MISSTQHSAKDKTRVTGPVRGCQEPVRRGGFVYNGQQEGNSGEEGKVLCPNCCNGPEDLYVFDKIHGTVSKKSLWDYILIKK